MINKRKSIGRPKMESGRRVHVLKAKLNEEELREVMALANSLGLSRTELVRLRLFASGGVLVNGSELLRILDGIGAELGRCGNNINQLARHANILSKHAALPPALIAEYIALLSAHNQIALKLDATIRQMLKLMKG